MITPKLNSDSKAAWMLVGDLGIVMSVIFGFAINAFSNITLPVIDGFECSH